MNTWQTIESAPKDGECFLGLERFATGEGIFSVCLYYNGRMESADDGEPRLNLTHWMPLPELPK